MKKKADRAKQVKKFLRNLYKSLYTDAKDRNLRRVQGTCEWFTGHGRFQDWKDGKTCGLLWVSADPGCGKSVLSRYLVDEILPSSPSSTTCYFFFKDDFEDQRSAAGALCCLLRQLFKEKPAFLRDSILERYDEDGDMLLNSFHELWRILVSISTYRGSGQIVCILDALDECEEHDRRLLTQTLNDFYLNSGTNTNLRFLVTSRPYAIIEREFHGIQTEFPVIHLRGEGQSESDKITREIDLVVGARIIQLCKKLRLTKNEENVMKREMTQNPNRTYLWVHLVFELLEGCVGHSSTQIEEHIRNIPPTVDDAYEKILSRSPDKNKARKLLHMVLSAKRPLQLKEMAVAVSLEKNHTLYSQLKIEPEERLSSWARELCGLFVSIIDGKVYLLHQTAAEFLVKRAGDGGARGALLEEDNSRSEWKCSFSPESSNLRLGSVCAQLLLFTDVVDDAGNYLDTDLSITTQSLNLLDEKYPFFRYSVDHWTTRLGDVSRTKDLPLSNMLQLCSGSESACFVQMPFWGRDRSYRHAKALTPLVTVSILGLAPVARHLLKQESTNVNEKDAFFKLPPLSWAVQGGHRTIFDIFIEAEDCYQKTVHRLKRVLRRCRVDFDARNHPVPDHIVRNITLKGPYTPLGWALYLGEEYFVEKLLATGRVMVTNDMLFAVAREDREDTLKALLKTGQVRVRCKAEDGRRLLNWAISHGAVRVTKYLLETGKFDISKETRPWAGELSGLAFASKRGADELLRLLLATGQTDINLRNDAFDGRTAISYAAEAGSQECIRLLLAAGNVEVDVMGLDKRTPLCYAAQWGHEGVVRQLLATGKVAINTSDWKGRTPLSYASECGYVGIVQQLLATGEAVVDTRDQNKRTPLSYAAEGGHEEIARQLLAMEADINAGDQNGRTPFLYAMKSCRERFVADLLAAGDVDVNTEDQDGYTPLFFAISWGLKRVVRQLLAMDKVDANATWQGYLPLMYANMLRRLEMVKDLLETRGITIRSEYLDFESGWRICLRSQRR